MVMVFLHPGEYRAGIFKLVRGIGQQSKDRGICLVTEKVDIQVCCLTE